MNDLLGLEWWRLVWVPLASGGLVFLATRFKTNKEARAGIDGRLDGRYEKIIDAQDEQIAELRGEVRELNTRLETEQGRVRLWERTARNLHALAREYRHDLTECRMLCARMDRERGITRPPVADLTPLPE